MATLSTLAPYVAQRIEEPPAAPVFWNLQAEIYTALMEACCDALLLVGRPDLIVNQKYSFTENTVWQPMPSGIVMITDIQGPATPLWKVSLYEMDYTQAVNGSGWENDVVNPLGSPPQYPQRWFPVGTSMFGIWPATSAAMDVTLTGIASPVIDSFPFTGNEAVPFHDEFFEALEEYAAHYLRLKETGSEFQESMALYQNYLGAMERMTQIEDRKDPEIFSKAIGAMLGVTKSTQR